MSAQSPKIETKAWIRKARALLVPSPFAAIDPSGEPEREIKLRDYLSRQLTRCGLTLDPEDPAEREAWRLAAEDAYESDVDVRADATREQTTAIVLKHPLSAEPQKERYDRVSPAQASEDFELFCNRLPEAPQSTDLPDFVRILWLNVMTAKGVKEQPLSQLPGSVWMPDHSVLAHRSLTAALHGARHQDQAALLYLHVGPVQSFIQASRRTHDLWTSSFTIAFLTYIAAEKLAKLVGPDALLFPDLSLLPLARKRLFQKQPEPALLTHSSLANKLLAVVPGLRAESVAQEITKAVETEWKEMASAAKAEIEEAWKKKWSEQPWDENHLLPKWDDQIATHLEMDVVIQPWPQQRNKLEQLLQKGGLAIPTTLHADAPAQPRVDEDQRVGIFYGGLFDHSHRLMAAHRSAQLPHSTPGDSRPKCVQCVRREQMGPIATVASHQQSESSRFFEQLSQALQSKDGGNNSDEDRLSLQLGAGEGLCAVCLVKRLLPKVYYGNEKSKLGLSWQTSDDRRFLRFPSVSSLATAPVRYLLLLIILNQGEYKLPKAADLEEAQSQLDKWCGQLDTLCGRDSLDFSHPKNLLPGLQRYEQQQSAKRLLEVDGSWLYPESYVFETVWRNHFDSQDAEQNKKKVERGQTISQQLSQAKRALNSLLALAECKPSPYLAVLCADVDYMGKWLTGRKAPNWSNIAEGEALKKELTRKQLTDKRRPLYPALAADLSRRLGKLATETFLQVVEQECLGRVVYGGGDDLLAFLPLQTALHCMQRLNQEMQSPEHLGKSVTLSAGLHIMHWRDPLSRAIESARKAEERAKDCGRNRFVISLDKRAGAATVFDLPWSLHAPKLPASPTRNALDVLNELLANGFCQQKGASEPGPQALWNADSEEEKERWSTQAAYELEQEILPLLSDAAVRLDTKEAREQRRLVLDALLHRTKVLCGFKKRTEWPGELLLWNETKEETEAGKKLPAVEQEKRNLERRSRNLRRLVEVLLFVRFLQREEHGLSTDRLLKALRQERAS